MNAYFLYAAMTADGVVKVGISSVPCERVAHIHANSPFPIKAVMWTWVGSAFNARSIEKRLKELWRKRNTRGEWFRFDFNDPDEVSLFYMTITAVVEAQTGKPAEWKQYTEAEVKQMVKDVMKASFSRYAM